MIAESVMPTWAQVVLALAALVTAIGVLWTKVLRPGAKLISTTEEMLPLLRTLTTTFRDTPASLLVLRDIANQFSTDSGSSLRDVVNRLEATSVETKSLLEMAARELRQSDEALKVGVETTKQLAAIDRESQRQLMLEVSRLTTQISEISATGIIDRAQIASNLKDREQKVDKASDSVAADLAASQGRAEAIGVTGSQGPGAAADAAALPSTPEERREVRREIEEARRAQWEIDQEADDTDEESPS